MKAHRKISRQSRCLETTKRQQIHPSIGDSEVVLLSEHKAAGLKTPSSFVAGYLTSELTVTT
jgi:hypothetical protein